MTIPDLRFFQKSGLLKDSSRQPSIQEKSFCEPVTRATSLSLQCDLPTPGHRQNAALFTADTTTTMSAAKGAKTFKTKCSQCHTVEEVRQTCGPAVTAGPASTRARC